MTSSQLLSNQSKEINILIYFLISGLALMFLILLGVILWIIKSRSCSNCSDLMKSDKNIKKRYKNKEPDGDSTIQQSKPYTNYTPESLTPTLYPNQNDFYKNEYYKEDDQNYTPQNVYQNEKYVKGAKTPPNLDYYIPPDTSYEGTPKTSQSVPKTKYSPVPSNSIKSVKQSDSATGSNYKVEQIQNEISWIADKIRNIEEKMMDNTPQVDKIRKESQGVFEIIYNQPRRDAGTQDNFYDTTTTQYIEHRPPSPENIIYPVPKVIQQFPSKYPDSIVKSKDPAYPKLTYNNAYNENSSRTNGAPIGNPNNRMSNNGAYNVHPYVSLVNKNNRFPMTTDFSKNSKNPIQTTSTYFERRDAASSRQGFHNSMHTNPMLPISMFTNPTLANLRFHNSTRHSPISRSPVRHSSMRHNHNRHSSHNLNPKILNPNCSCNNFKKLYSNDHNTNVVEANNEEVNDADQNINGSINDPNFAIEQNCFYNYTVSQCEMAVVPPSPNPDSYDHLSCEISSSCSLNSIDLKRHCRSITKINNSNIKKLSKNKFLLDATNA